MLHITERGEWIEWLVYFLNGVAAQAEDVIEKMLLIDELLSGWNLELVRDRSRLPEKALEQFAPIRSGPSGLNNDIYNGRSHCLNKFVT